VNCRIYRCGVLITSLAVLFMALFYRQAIGVTSDFMLYATKHYPTVFMVSPEMSDKSKKRIRVTKRHCPEHSRRIGPVSLEDCDSGFAIRTSEHARYMLLKSGGYGFFMGPVLAWLNTSLPGWTVRYHAYVFSLIILWFLLFGFFMFFASAWSVSAGIIAVLVVTLEPTIAIALIFFADSELLVWTFFAWTMFFLYLYGTSRKTVHLVMAFAFMGMGMANKFTFVFLMPIILFSGFFPGRVTKQKSLLAITAFIIAVSPHLMFLYAFPEFYIKGMLNGAIRHSSNVMIGNVLTFIKLAFLPGTDGHIKIPSVIILLRIVTVLALGAYAISRGSRRTRQMVMASFGTGILIVLAFFIWKKGIAATRVYDMWPMIEFPVILGAYMLLTRANRLIAVVASVLVLLPFFIAMQKNPIRSYEELVLPIARVRFQRSLFDALQPYHESHPIMVDYDTWWHFFSKGLLDYASAGRVRPISLHIKKAPKAPAEFLRRIVPKGRIVFIWLKPRPGLAYKNEETKKFMENLMKTIPHKVLKILDKDGDKLIEFCPDRPDCSMGGSDAG